MTELIVLIDPNDVNLERLIEQVNVSKPKNVWVGCSVSTEDGIIRTFHKLEVPASFYPGTFDQLKKIHGLAKHIYISDPLFFTDLGIKRLFGEVSDYALQNLLGKFDFMNYVVLTPDCSSAKILGVYKNPSDKEVIKKLEQVSIHPYVYLEGGSRNTDFSIANRVDLAKRINSKYQHSKIICGGGITSLNELGRLKDNCSYVLASNMLHRNPSLLEACMDVF
ncbi:MAG: hypothetical protein AABW51_04305 [Nanoarchaeota archaeon]